MKENEWIISPKKLKENQEKSYLLEKQNKKQERITILEALGIVAGSLVFGITLAFMFIA